jgi:uncharacterized protein VirK/YbjX
MLIGHLLALFRAEWAGAGAVAACRSSLRASRIFLHATRVEELLGLENVRRLLASERGPEVLAFFSSPHYLCRELTLQERIQCAVHHYRYEENTFAASYAESVYGRGGLELWQTRSQHGEFAIQLMPANDNLYEGSLSVVLFVNGLRVCVLSFSWIDGAILGQPSAPILFVTRKQSGRHPEHLKLFAQTFQHSSPPYFCFAAIAGVALANGASQIATIKHRSHPSFAERDADALRRTYDEFWQVFGAQDLDPKSYRIPVPFELTELNEVGATHRRRARIRRSHWAEVTASASAKLGVCRR